MQSIGDGTNFERRPVKNSAMSIYTVGRSYFLESYHCWYLVRSELSNGPTFHGIRANGCAGAPSQQGAAHAIAL
jgi:hypothetical protein